MKTNTSNKKEQAASMMKVANGSTSLIWQGERLFTIFSVFLLLLHSWQALKSGDHRIWTPHLVAWLHDILILGCMLMASKILMRLTPQKIRPAVEAILFTVFVCCGAALSIYPQQLREYLGLTVNIFAVDTTTAWTTLTMYLGVNNLWPVIIVAMMSIFVYARPAIARPGIRRKSLSVGIITLLIIAALATLPRSPHPLIASIRLQFTELISGKNRAVPSLNQSTTQDIPVTSQQNRIPDIDTGSTIDHLFLIVLEGVTSEDFERVFMSRQNGFYQRVKEKSAWFSNYHTTNLDSYTSLIAMLTGEQVPYRSYADVSLYEQVNKTDNLTRTLHSRGHYGLFISTYAEQPFVPTRTDWNSIMDRDDLPSLDGWLSLGSSRMEQATEDMAALDTIIQTASDNPRSFILHELVYGHSTEWQATTGKSQLDYYDDYLNELLDRLEAKGLDTRSLLVVVSDHGDRAKVSNAGNYRVPLLIAGNNITPLTDNAFRTHLDLPAIIAGSMNNASLPAPREEAFVVGSTERWIYGSITADQQYLIIDDQTGTILSTTGSLSATTVNQKFQATLNSFCDRFPRKDIPTEKGYQIAKTVKQ